MGEVAFIEAERRIFAEREPLTVSQWAEKYRKVEQGPHQGQWTNSLTPYLVKPMDTLTLPWVQKIFLQFAPQTGKTQVMMNFLAFCADQQPGPMMYIMPDEGVAKRISRRRIRPMLEQTPRTAGLLSARTDDTTTRRITFTNGMDLMMGWAGSAAVLASESARYMLFDEVDKYPDFTGKEADPLSLGEVRTTAYPYNRKLLYVSTPTDEAGYIHRLMTEQADEVWQCAARCPVCQKLQRMDFERIHWPGDIRDPRLVRRKKLARYDCAHCGMEWDDYLRDKAVSACEWQCVKLDDSGQWVAAEPIVRPLAVGFHLPSWYSPFVSLSDAAAAFLDGQEDPAKFMAFVTQHKAEAWVDRIEHKNESEMLERHVVEMPPSIVPAWAIAVTVGVDVQKIGFWFVVRAWDAESNNHLVEYGYLSSFDDVDTLLFNTRWQQEKAAARMGVWRAAMDTGGGESGEDDWTRTEEIYQYIRSKPPGLVFAVKGASRPQLQRVRVSQLDRFPRSNKPIPGGLELRTLDTEAFKDLLHWRLGRKKDESQRFSLHGETGMDYVKQFLAEEKRRERKTRRVRWTQIRRDNHLLDCEVYAAACADSSWMPNLKMLANLQRMPQRPQPTPAVLSDKPGGGWITTGGGWFDR
jgi:phage terminase large subunit GpA-like protein